MKTTVASVALAIVFCGLAVAQEMPPRLRGCRRARPGRSSLVTGQTALLFGWIVPESGGKTPT
jgi:hypothetical protein